jgi:hypothetical protein
MSTSSQTYLGATQNLVSSCSGAVQPLLSSQVTLSGAQGSYYAIQSGQIISVGTLTAPLIIYLPPVGTSAGHQFTVVCSNPGVVAHQISITSQTATAMKGVGLQGAAANPGAAQAITGWVSGAAATTIQLLASNYRSGDRVECKCDGVSWVVMGWGVAAAGTQTFQFA